MTEEIKRLRRVCFTGHRPEKLNRSEKSVLGGLETAIRQAIADGSNVFISGMDCHCHRAETLHDGRQRKIQAKESGGILPSLDR